jgi:cytochrome c peroxidase
MPRLRTALVVSLLGLVAACGGGAGESLSPEAALGREIFFDTGLSASGRLSCASCHDPSAAHAPPNGLAFQLGGIDGRQPGRRSTPSIRYLFAAGAFRLDAEGNPSGGFFRDGRADTLAAQAKAPLLNPREMANASVEDVVRRLAAAPYAARFAALHGERVFSEPQRAFDLLARALERYQLEDHEFRPFDSKFDAVQAGRARFTAAEARGRAIFDDPARGNCAACHPSTRGADGTPALFTDFSYDNLGVPRHRGSIDNADPTHFDLGLCERSALRERTDLCGAFKVPTLRNVATRRVFFHNGVITSLDEALRFYVTRDTDAAHWYPGGEGGRYDDVPAAYATNVNSGEAPYDRLPGQAPALNAGERADLAAFLRTLNDGWRP